MDRYQIMHLLQSQRGLERVTESDLSAVTAGSVSPHTYHLRVAYPELHNALNDEGLVRDRAPNIEYKLTRQDDGFYRRSITRCARDGYEQLLRLRPYGLPILDEWQTVADHLRGQLEPIAEAFSSMPFAWLHHDFREGSILGDPQRLIDWGSSYGHGPFFFDRAPFLVNDPAGLALFVRSP